MSQKPDHSGCNFRMSFKYRTIRKIGHVPTIQIPDVSKKIKASVTVCFANESIIILSCFVNRVEIASLSFSDFYTKMGQVGCKFAGFHHRLLSMSFQKYSKLNVKSVLEELHS